MKKLNFIIFGIIVLLALPLISAATYSYNFTTNGTALIQSGNTLTLGINVPNGVTTIINTTSSDNQGGHTIVTDFNRSLVGYWNFKLANSTYLPDSSPSGLAGVGSSMRFGVRTYGYNWNSAIINNDTDSNLVAAYHFENNVNDAKGINNGTATNVTYSAGKFLQSANFNGLNSGIVIPNSPSINITNNLTFSAWIYPTSYPATYSTILTKGDTVYRLWYTGGGALECVFANGASIAVTSYSIPRLNTWTYVVCQYSANATNNTYSIYIDGQLNKQAIGSVNNTLLTNTNPLYIGTRQSDRWFNGSIDDIRIYNRILTASEINATYYASIPNQAGYFMQGSAGNFWDMGNNAATNLTGNQLTMSVWMNAQNQTVSYAGIMGKGIPQTAADAYSLKRNNATNQLQFVITNSSSNQVILNFGGNTFDNKWHLITVTYDGSLMKAYIDGVLNGSVAQTGNITYTSPNFNIGTFANSGGYYYKGYLDDALLYKRALSSQEVLALYDANSYQYSNTFATSLNTNYSIKAYQMDIAERLGYTATTIFMPLNYSSCTESWSCTAWSSCNGVNQTRTCTDGNACGTTTNKPAELQSCSNGGGAAGGGGPIVPSGWLGRNNTFIMPNIQLPQLPPIIKPLTDFVDNIIKSAGEKLNPSNPQVGSLEVIAVIGLGIYFLMRRRY